MNDLWIMILIISIPRLTHKCDKKVKKLIEVLVENKLFSKDIGMELRLDNTKLQRKLSRENITYTTKEKVITRTVQTF